MDVKAGVMLLQLLGPQKVLPARGALGMDISVVGQTQLRSELLVALVDLTMVPLRVLVFFADVLQNAPFKLVIKFAAQCNVWTLVTLNDVS